jgi:predicted Zn-dependent protease
LADGLAAHAAGDMETVIRAFTPTLPRLADIGGSHAQRDLFDQLLLDALLKAKRYIRAQQILELRRQADPHSKPIKLALAATYRALGLPSLAS